MDLRGIGPDLGLAYPARGDGQHTANLEMTYAGTLYDEISRALDAAFDARPRGYHHAGRGHGETVAGRRSTGNRPGRFVD